MTFMLRDRPDGQVEFIVNKPVLIGVFPERELAERFCLWLQEDEAFGQVEDGPAGFATASADVAEVEAAVLDAPPPKSTKPRQERRANLPAVVDLRTPTALLPVFQPKTLTESQVDAAFARIAGGEKIVVVALDIGLTMGQLRGMWASHKRQLQRHLAEGGQQACTGCQRHFTPSISNPDKCARCSYE